MTEELQPLAGLSLERAIRLRWALRDIKAKRTKVTPVSPDDLQTLIELGLVEMWEELPSSPSTAREPSTETSARRRSVAPPNLLLRRPC